MCFPSSDSLAVRLYGDVRYARYEKCREKDLTRSRTECRLALPMIYTAHKKAELKHAGYAIQDSMADPLFSHTAMREAADMAMEYPVMKVEKLYEFVMSTFPGKGAIKA